MTAEQLFSILNLMTMAAWLLLVFLPRVRWTSTVVTVVMPSLLAVIYVVLVAATLARSEGGFSSLAGVTIAGRCWPGGRTTWHSTCSSAGGRCATPSAAASHTCSSCLHWF